MTAAPPLLEPPAQPPLPAAPASSPAGPAPDLSTSRLARVGVAIVVFGFFLFAIGIFPDLIRLGLTPGIGLLQIGLFLFGTTLMTLGAYIYAYATRHRLLPRRLREDVGLRLMATGQVVAYATGFADVLGIGSHYGAERPLLGALQTAGIALGIFVTVAGIFLYARR
ncbi:MAG: hypothetical protein IT317_23935 [Anaerolineales bacterium]|nr:hypothetical protein [Anaerolineales bacterium]